MHKKGRVYKVFYGNFLEKCSCSEKSKDFQLSGNHWLEPARQFILAIQQAEKYAQQESAIGGRDFLKKIGSNFRIADRTLACDFKNAFKIAEKYHAEALCAEAVSYDFAKSENWR